MRVMGTPSRTLAKAWGKAELDCLVRSAGYMLDYTTSQVHGLFKLPCTEMAERADINPVRISTNTVDRSPVFFGPVELLLN